MFRTTNNREISKIIVPLILKIESRKSKSVRVDNQLNNKGNEKSIFSINDYCRNFKLQQR